jgi:hypothetical protein
MAVNAKESKAATADRKAQNKSIVSARLLLLSLLLLLLLLRGSW